MDSKQHAQQRCDQIAAFRQELDLLGQEGVVELSSESHIAISRHHDKIIQSLSASFDIDTNQADKQLSLGMRSASFLGSMAFAASIFFLFYQYWGMFSTAAQSAILVLSPLISLAITGALYKYEHSGYFARIGGLITLACFVLNLSMLGQIYNLAPTPNAFIVWSLLALGLAYKTRSRVTLAFAIMLFAGFLSARMGSWFGGYWLSFGERPENFFLPAILVFCMGHIQQRHFEDFSAIYRVFGACMLLFPVLLLAHWSGSSYLSFELDVTEGIYQTLGFVLSAALIWHGIRHNWRDTLNTGSSFFTLFLFTKLFDWWWDWLPKYLFFLLIALTSVGVLMLFKHLRTRLKTTNQGESNV